MGAHHGARLRHGDQLANVASAYVEIAYIGHGASRTVDVPYTLLDSEGNPVSTDGLELETDTISVTVNINMTKQVPLTISANYGAGARRRTPASPSTRRTS